MNQELALTWSLSKEIRTKIGPCKENSLLKEGQLKQGSSKGLPYFKAISREFYISIGPLKWPVKGNSLFEKDYVLSQLVPVETEL